MAGSGTSHLRDGDDVLLRAERVVVEYPMRGSRQRVRAVSDVSLDIGRGETLGLVGESGCGKSTIGRAILQLPRPNAGSVHYDGVELTALSGRRLRAYRRDIQMVFQDPLSSLNPRQQIGEILADPLRVWKHGTPAERERLVADTLEVVGLDPSATLTRRPHQFSGGQCQRISIARCLVLRPGLLICDEPVSALDVSVQAQVLNLLEDMKARYGLSLLFIAHDLAVVKNISDRVAVMYLGKLCEVGAPEKLYQRPAHPYTDLLLRSIPEPDPSRPLPDADLTAGELPSPADPPSGCRFRTRCPRATQLCAEEEPVMRELGVDHHVACHHPLPTSAVPAAAPTPERTPA
ncbi:ATP-binding cassette domain-containing protein [Frankia sp. CNm7]|uniref:ATP-binding cassette domain-containing protein n=1 Tax=Frankia nepalensis TaxID=1836974 RepID=A0A937RFN2_9ACTN|nr:oligopeptide/dipeptide ABC transporter ATP-binding protein [Frankia nepalensis]MBL7502684.1 ATP-binding cassette domain-containing protein [Frankia nepalensis]MBL7515033.1 ATP-binding cassette domain-containing protein [Frankia nepalensis]MBL7518718.1 ATP-binding cassette domain-containing protein [Frankia nepalensis]MBL7629157.1 ATP-binding cassette domain-containing protein [Frankia nepalensis]